MTLRVPKLPATPLEMSEYCFMDAVMAPPFAYTIPVQLISNWNFWHHSRYGMAIFVDKTVGHEY